MNPSLASILTQALTSSLSQKWSKASLLSQSAQAEVCVIETQERALAFRRGSRRMVEEKLEEEAIVGYTQYKNSTRSTGINE